MFFFFFCFFFNKGLYSKFTFVFGTIYYELKWERPKNYHFCQYFLFISVSYPCYARFIDHLSVLWHFFLSLFSCKLVGVISWDHCNLNRHLQQNYILQQALIKTVQPGQKVFVLQQPHKLWTTKQQERVDRKHFKSQRRMQSKYM